MHVPKESNGAALDASPGPSSSPIATLLSRMLWALHFFRTARLVSDAGAMGCLLGTHRVWRRIGLSLLHSSY